MLEETARKWLQALRINATEGGRALMESPEEQEKAKAMIAEDLDRLHPDDLLSIWILVDALAHLSAV